MRFTFLILFTALFLTGCVSSLDRLGYIPKGNLEKEISELRVANENDLRVKQAELKTALERVISGKNEQIQRGANAAYSANYAFKFYEKPARLDIIINTRVQEFMAAMGVPPTLEAIKEENDRLARELDETLTSIEELRATSEAKIKENEQLVSATQAFERKVAQLEEEKIKIEREGLEKLIVKQEELNDANNIIIAKEKENAESRKYIEANKLRISIASGLLAVACVAGAFFSPIFKDKLALGAGLFGAISVGIIFLEPWHVSLAFALIFIVGLTWFLRKHFISHKTNENLINAIQSIKDKGGNIYETHIKPELSEWNTKYLKSGDKIKDKTVTGHIDEILKDYERK
jgi:membrane protein implicated in regulation of membrane protease activity